MLLTAGITFLMICGCATNRYKNGIKVGKWVEKTNLDTVEYKRVQYYKMGVERGTWKTYANGHLLSKEKYKRDTCYTTFYYPNGKINSIGKTVKTMEKEGYIHWFYIGKWEFFDLNGRLDFIRIYRKDLDPEEILVK